MLPPENRLRRTKDIKRVLKEGQRLRLEHSSPSFLPGATDATRIACIVSKKVSPKATVRHRQQRRLRAVALDLIKNLPSDKIYDIVWIAAPHAAEATFNDIKTDADKIHAELS